MSVRFIYALTQSNLLLIHFCSRYIAATSLFLWCVLCVHPERTSAPPTVPHSRVNILTLRSQTKDHPSLYFRQESSFYFSHLVFLPHRTSEDFIFLISAVTRYDWLLKVNRCGGARRKNLTITAPTLVDNEGTNRKQDFAFRSEMNKNR